MAQHAKQVYGVEIVPAAIDNARQNADKNGITNATFVLDSAEKAMAKWQADGVKPDVIVVDPPRKGLDADFIRVPVKWRLNGWFTLVVTHQP